MVNERNIRIIFWGTGNVACTFVKCHEFFMRMVEVVGFADNDENRWNTFFGDYKVFCPEVLLKEEYDYILILSIYYREIKKGLLDQYRISPIKILSVDEAYQIYVKNIHGVGNGYQFGSEPMLTQLAFSKRIREKMLEGMNNMFAYLYVKDKYAHFIEKFRISLNHDIVRFSPQILKEDTPIWVCWLQGLENAPNIVKCCINSIVANVKGKIQIITYDNYSEYVQIDEIILEKHKMGIISKTHFSDVIRLALLCKHGGIWIDSTILMMDRGLPDYIYQLPIFMHKVRETMDAGYYDPRVFTNWFIKSEKGHPVIKAVYELLENWWKTENETPYCIFHYIVRIVWDAYTDYINFTDGDFRFQDRLVLYDNNCRILERLLNENYDEILWNILKSEEPLQKLSYKMKPESGKTFYNYIIEHYGS